MERVARKFVGTELTSPGPLPTPALSEAPMKIEPYRRKRFGEAVHRIARRLVKAENEMQQALGYREAFSREESKCSLKVEGKVEDEDYSRILYLKKKATL